VTGAAALAAPAPRPAGGARFARWRRGDAASGLGLVAPAFLYAVAMLAAPLGAVVAVSFWTQDFLTFDRTFTWANYEKAWTDPLYRLLMLRSLGISAAATLATVLLAFPVAYYISFHVRRRKGLWMFLITIPFWTSYLLRVFLWRVILGYDGVLNTGLLSLGLIEAPLTALLYNANAVVLTLAHAWAPFAILPIYVALEKIDRSLLEASRDLGESATATFLRVTLPLAMPGVIAATLIVFIPTVGDYVTPRLVGGPDGLMIANMIEVQFKRANDAPLGAALAISAMLVVGAIALAFLAATRRFREARA
jgi:spermidine/putrescine transport system permease protein